MSDTTPTRIYPKSECQKDPVFLVQSRQFVCTNEDNYEWDEDGPIGDNGEPIDDEYMEESEDWVSVWTVEGVFFDRDEAKAWARAREYRWKAWRTYGVSAIGDLAKILAPLTTYWDGKPYKRNVDTQGKGAR